MTHCPGHGRTHGSVSDGVQSHCFIGTSLFHLSRHFHTLTLDPELQFPTSGIQEPKSWSALTKKNMADRRGPWIPFPHMAGILRSISKLVWNNLDQDKIYIESTAHTRILKRKIEHSNRTLKYLYQGQYLARFFVVSVDENHIYNLYLKDCHNYRVHIVTNWTSPWKDIDLGIW